ncbi:plastid/chloroplast ribosomal protein S5 [Volvox carteri f. nagariensis]|uniref:Plastid/chloroplast ribosomal protein S5 n=1 Tax=Volvox carteri f. nagariensis TaxID=3068 RepID=D8TTR8_VOLCA|nr:plastid/chloroplast ribosomal protein S5 [Volvox carteri f. nagariensis]EFJ49243.1 plastid/chloroplast ribosomal protein S5 [Volvox carteri f. nagariensis]|eukprot:XP_002949691.1 plastid/chloroplast ribosomal protein S5 [Volvox carteri f. nagariensis]
MATLTAPSGATTRAARSQAKVSAGSISSRRVRPFTRAIRSVAGAPRQQVLVRAAEPEVEEFSFSFSDAKKGNEYAASDVEAALRFYEGESVAPGDVNSEFVENLFGIEDASFFDDMDNNEAYDDEFIAAGIPEAAPKQRQGRQRGGEEEGDAGDSDEIAAAKQADRLREIEEQMVLEAELQETGLDEEVEESANKPLGPAVWDWMTDIEIEDDDEEVSAVAGSSKTIAANVMAALPSDEQVFSDLRSASLQDLDLETRDTIEFLLDDFDIENEVKVIPDNIEEVFAVPEFTQFGDSDLQRIDALLGEDLSLLEDDVEGLENVPEIVDDGLEMSDDAVEKYVASLKGAQAVEMSDDQIKELFGDEPVQKVDLEAEASVSLDDVDLNEPTVEPLAESELVFESIENKLEEVDEVDTFRAELLALRAMPESFVEIPSREEIEMLDEYVAASEQFLDAEEARKAQLAEQVIKGELPPDVLDNEDDEFVDVETELLMPDDMDDLEEEDEFDDDENWQERILELSRVTKVVKGGKLMGFRCTAVVGNGNGLVGVGCQSGREVATAVKRALVDAKKSVVRVPLVGAGTVPHRVEAKFNAARCVILPAADGTGVLAGSSIRSVLELSGVQNVLAKRLGCRSLLNNARCAVAALEQLRTLQEVSKARGVPMDRLLVPSRRK